jgi:acetyl-CoA carboxylase biotin carboxylase subunit
MSGGLGIRIETAAYPECVISPYYDSLIAKVISFAGTRTDAIARMKRALEMSVIEGVKTTIPLHQRILDDQSFLDGRLTTRFLTQYSQG